MALEPGTLVAGYRIEGVLGAGGMGTVYLARHPALPRNDALKILSAELSGDPEFRARFTREADLAATLDHPNIVTVYNRGETEAGQLWIAMQYVAGTDADAELRAGNMPAPRAVHIVSEVAKALDYAHSRNLLHRDVKPANFLLSPGGVGEPERVLLADFGIARARDDATGLTSTGAVMATVAYASPEAIDGDDVDGRADIYSLGCALYRLLTGKAPFHHVTGMTAVMMAHLQQPPPRVTDNAPWVPPAMNGVIAKAMAKDPAARYQTGRELANAAVAALRGETVSTTGPTVPGGWQPGGAHPPVPPPPVVSPHASTPRAAVRQQPDFAPVRRRSKKLWVAASILAVLLLVGGSVTAFALFGGDDEPAYATTTFTHAHGATTLTSRPQAVAAVGPGDASALLALGVQPVAISTTSGQLPSWDQELVTGSPPVSATLNIPALEAAQPDLIVATGELDDATFAALQAVAPTITRPEDAGQWLWTDQLSWIGRIMGYPDRAQQLIADTKASLDATRAEYPQFGGKTVSVVTASDSSTVADLRESNPTSYVEALGFLYNGELTRSPGQGPQGILFDGQTYVLDADVLILGRTDINAGDGGYADLPASVSAFGGTIVIVDNPDIIAALDTGGPSAINYLNETMVPEMAKVVN